MTEEEKPESTDPQTTGDSTDQELPDSLEAAVPSTDDQGAAEVVDTVEITGSAKSEAAEASVEIRSEEEEDDTIKDKDLIEASQAPRKVRKFKQTGRWLVIFFGMFVVSLPLTVFLATQLRTPVVRHVLLLKLDDKNMQERQKALNYIINHFKEDATLREDVLGRILNEEDAERRAELEEAIRQADAWSPDLGAVWINYQGRDLNFRSMETRVTLTIMLGQLARENHAVSKLPETRALLWNLAKDQEMLVRRETLATIMQTNDALRREFLGHFLQDSHWQIVSEAWLYLSLMPSQQIPEFPTYDALPGEWSEPERLEVTRAILMARKVHDPNAWQVLMSVAQDEKASMGLRGFAYSLLRDVPQTSVMELGVQWIDAAEVKMDDPNLFLAWRAMVGIPINDDPQSPAVQAILRFLRRTEALLVQHESRINATTADSPQQWKAMEQASHLDAARAAGIARIAPVLLKDQNLMGLQPGWSNRAVTGRYEKAFWENLPAKSLKLTMDLGEVATQNSWPHVILALAGRTIQDTTVDDFEFVFRQPDEKFLTQTADTLGQALTAEQNAEFLKRMIGIPNWIGEPASLYDSDRMGAALMVALGYGKPDRFKAWLEEVKTTTTHVKEPVWRVAEYQRLAVMRYRKGTDMDLLNRLRVRSGTDIARDSLALVLMRRGNLEGFEILFNHVDEISEIELRKDEPRVRMWELLGHYRMWMMMRDCLPLEARDIFETYADPELQHFQTLRLRAWYLMNAKHLSFDMNAGHYNIYR